MKRFLPTLLAVGALAAIFTTSANADSLIIYSPGTGNYYQSFSTVQGWYNAKTKCIEKGAHLAVINSNAEFVNTIKPIIELSPADYWLGASFTQAAGVTTVTGQDFYFPPYPDSNPTFTFNTSVFYGWDNSQQWTDFLANTSQRYICEWESAPL